MNQQRPELRQPVTTTQLGVDLAPAVAARSTALLDDAGENSSSI